VSDHLSGAAERAMNAASFDISQASSQLGVNDSALFRRIFGVSGRQLGKDGDHTTRNFEL
jgi:hypothetical protein